MLKAIVTLVKLFILFNVIMFCMGTISMLLLISMGD